MKSQRNNENDNYTITYQSIIKSIIIIVCGVKLNSV